MASFSARLLAFILRKTGIIRRNFTGGADFAALQARALAEHQGPSRKWLRKIRATPEAFQGRTVWRLEPNDASPASTLLYWHGGGYIYPAAAAHWDFLCGMVLRHGWRVIAPLYPLAPPATVEEVTGFALNVWRDIIGKHNPATMVMAGDSAGAGLTAATLMASRDAGLPLPAKAILISPWLDAAANDPAQPAIEPRDALLTIGGIREAGLLYAGAAGIADPRVSPIHGDWTGLPPMLGFGGGDDILVTDARALKRLVPSLDYDERAGLIHDWPIFNFPESRDAQARMAAFAKV